jgi:hypothetical protein
VAAASAAAPTVIAPTAPRRDKEGSGAKEGGLVG